MRRVVILGGGFGGLATAHTLRALRPGDEIVIVDHNTHFMVGFRKTWGLLGAPPDVGRGRLADLAQYGLEVVQGTVTKVDPVARVVEVNGGRLEADALVVALGAQLAVDQVPGFSEHACNVYEPAAIAANAAALRAFSGGRILIGVMGLPYKCPPAPYEIALLVKESLDDRGVPADVSVFTPLPSSLPVAGPAACEVIEGRLAQKGIRFLPNHKATAVTSDAVLFGDKPEPYDLLLGVPAHRCPAVISASGLTGNGGWVQVDPKTLETAFPHVYAVGDITEIFMGNGKPLPMAGVFAEAQGKVAAQRIAAVFDGREPEATFDGIGGCFLEVGGGEALLVEGNFLAEDGPQVSLSDADGDKLAQKQQFEQERLREWFPPTGGSPNV